MPSILDWAPSAQAVAATMVSWLLTSAGALAVFFFRREHKLLMNGMLAAGAGVMLASSFWSLLSPALSLANAQRQNIMLHCALGFMAGGLFLLLGEWVFERITHQYLVVNDTQRRRRLLIASITLHNIPEGLAIGVAFGAAIQQNELLAAWMLAIGIGLQNIPEGAAVSLPLHRDGYSRTRSAGYGILSGVVEPMAGLFGVLLAATTSSILPFCLSFAAGAMIFVIVSELIPESQASHRSTLMTIASMLGFVIMMVLDVVLG